MKIVLSQHALQRCEQRTVAPQEVTAAVTKALAARQKGGLVLVRRLDRRVTVGKSTGDKVVCDFIIENGVAVVKTVMLTTKPV